MDPRVMELQCIMPIANIRSVVQHGIDPPTYLRLKSRKCAEVLVPDGVEPRFLAGVRAVDRAAQKRLEGGGCTLPIEIDPVLFFRS